MSSDNNTLIQEITCQTENEIWEAGIFHTFKNKGLVNAIYFYNVKIFGITCVIDHNNLERWYFEFSENEHGRYVTLDCKNLLSYKRLPNRQRKHFKNMPCKIIHYEDPRNPRSYYKLLKNYLYGIARIKTEKFYFKPNPKNWRGFIAERFGKHEIKSCVQEIMWSAGYNNTYTNQSLKPLMELSDEDAKEDHTGIEYMINARRCQTASNKTKEISKRLDPPLPSQPSTTTPVLPLDDPPVTVAPPAPHLCDTQEERAAPQQSKIHTDRHAPPQSFNRRLKKKSKLKKPSRISSSQEVIAMCTESNNQLQGVNVKTEELDPNNYLDNNQLQGVNVKTEELDPNNYLDSNLSLDVDVKSEELDPEVTSQECQMVDTSPQCHLKTVVDFQHGSFNIRLAELLPPGAKDVCIAGTKSNTEDQILLKVDFRVGQ